MGKLNKNNINNSEYGQIESYIREIWNYLQLLFSVASLNVQFQWDKLYHHPRVDQHLLKGWFFIISYTFNALSKYIILVQVLRIKSTFNHEMGSVSSGKNPTYPSKRSDPSISSTSRLIGIQIYLCPLWPPMPQILSVSTYMICRPFLDVRLVAYK